jgi:dolichyl-phosphate beta-glucosyltransferase
VAARRRHPLLQRGAAAARVPKTNPRLLRFDGKPDEIILVDDGSTDRTLDYMRELRRRCPAIKLVGFKSNRGKGRAVAEGVRVSRGAAVLYSDADLSTPIEELVKLQHALPAGADVAFASRGAPRAREVNRVVYRRLMGKLFNLMVQVVLLPGFRDTQCGFKLFRGIVARELFAELRTDGFAFDIEVLLRAKRAGYRLEEVPVHSGRLRKHHGVADHARAPDASRRASAPANAGLMALLTDSLLLVALDKKRRVIPVC